MKAVRLYDRPENFSEMIVRQLGENMGVIVERREEDPLLLDIWLKEDTLEERIRVSLHETFRTYKAGGDLNVAIDYLNGIVRSAQWVQDHKDNIPELDPSYLFPAIRHEDYIREGGQDCPLLSDECSLPGLRVIYLEIKDSCSKIVNEASLSPHSRLTEDRVRRIAYRNLRSEGWQHPRLELPSPSLSTCTVEVYTDYSHPVECQFLLPQMAAAHTPDSFVIAFTNRKYTLLLRSTDRMETKQKAQELVEKSKFFEVVKRSFHLLPQPVSQRMYWFHNGKAEFLD